MVQPTEIYNHFDQFAHASQCAKEAARLLAATTAVRWHKRDWIVLVPIGASVQLQADADLAVESDYEDNLAQLADVNSDDGMEEPYFEDLASDQDDWARSEEEGWYYADTDTE